MRFKPISTSKCCILMLRYLFPKRREAIQCSKYQTEENRTILFMEVLQLSRRFGFIQEAAWCCRDMRALHIASKYCWGLGF